MMFSIKNAEDLQKLNKLVSLESQVKTVRLQDKLGEKNYHQNAEKLYKPPTHTIKDASENLTKAITKSSNMNNEPLDNLKINF